MLKDEIKQLRREGKIVFYNEEGDKKYFQLGLRHLSSSVHEGLAFYPEKFNKTLLKTTKPLLLANFKTLKIEEIKAGESIQLYL